MGLLDSSKSQTSHKGKRRPETVIYIFPILTFLLAWTLNFESQCMDPMFLLFWYWVCFFPTPLPHILIQTCYKHHYLLLPHTPALGWLPPHRALLGFHFREHRPELETTKMIHKLIKWQKASYMGITVVNFFSFLLAGLLSSHQNSEDVFAELIGNRLDGASECFHYKV